MYFPETSKLLFEPDFIKFLSQVNEWYLEETNRSEYDNGFVFGYDITFEKWFEYANNIDFMGIAFLHAKRDFIHKDWELFNPKIHESAIGNTKLFNEERTAVNIEINLLKSRINQKDYLKPISKELIRLLDEIINQYSEYEISKNPLNKVTDMKIEPLQWNGGVGSLATLFHDLRTTKSSNGIVYLDYLPKQLLEFILKNFVDEKGEPFSALSISKYIDPKQKKAKKDRVDISRLDEEIE